jgi:hypothetical protein
MVVGPGREVEDRDEGVDMPGRALGCAGWLGQWSRMLAGALSVLVVATWSTGSTLCMGSDGRVWLEVGVHGHCADCDEHVVAPAGHSHEAPAEPGLTAASDSCGECDDIAAPGTDRASGRRLEILDFSVAVLASIAPFMPMDVAISPSRRFPSPPERSHRPAQSSVLRC